MCVYKRSNLDIISSLFPFLNFIFHLFYNSNGFLANFTNFVTSFGTIEGTNGAQTLLVFGGRSKS